MITVTTGATVLQSRRRPRPYWACTDALVLTARNLRHIPRIPEQLVFATLQPIMFVLLFRYVFGGAIQVGGSTSYVDYLMAGIFVQALALGAVNTAVGLAEDLQHGLVDRFRSLPMARSAVLVGRTLADLVRNLVVFLVMLSVGLLVGFRPEGAAVGWLGAAGLLLLLSFAFSWIGATLGLLIRNAEAVQQAVLSWLFPLTFASSAFVPTASMPAWLRAFATHQPLTLVIDTVRALFLGRPAGRAGQRWPGSWGSSRSSPRWLSRCIAGQQRARAGGLGLLVQRLTPSLPILVLKMDSHRDAVQAHPAERKPRGACHDGATTIQHSPPRCGPR